MLNGLAGKLAMEACCPGRNAPSLTLSFRIRMDKADDGDGAGSLMTFYSSRMPCGGVAWNYKHANDFVEFGPRFLFSRP